MPGPDAFGDLAGPMSNVTSRANEAGLVLVPRCDALRFHLGSKVVAKFQNAMQVIHQNLIAATDASCRRQSIFEPVRKLMQDATEQMLMAFESCGVNDTSEPSPVPLAVCLEPIGKYQVAYR